MKRMRKRRERSARAPWLPAALLCLGGGAYGGGRHGSRGDRALVGVGRELQVGTAGRHQADGVAGKQRQVLQVLWVEEEWRRHQVGCAARTSVGKQQVSAAIQRSYG